MEVIKQLEALSCDKAGTLRNCHELFCRTFVVLTDQID